VASLHGPDYFSVHATLAMSQGSTAPFTIGPLPTDRLMTTIDEQIVRAPLERIFRIAAEVEHWPAYLAHYRYVRFRARAADGGGLVEMAANRPFGVANWPTWWLSEMTVDTMTPFVRYRHVGGITKGMLVEWSFTPRADGVHTRIVHVWNGPAWPMIGSVAATHVIGPVFVHGIASRTLAGLARAAERTS
jgi:ribosome-associated toxin RatA of RatAB toxin-antitoxin module